MFFKIKIYIKIQEIFFFYYQDNEIKTVNNISIINKIVLASIYL